MLEFDQLRAQNRKSNTSHRPGFFQFLSNNNQWICRILERFSWLSWGEIWCFVVEFLWNLPEFSKKLLSLEKYRVRRISMKKAYRMLHTLHFFIIDLAKKRSKLCINPIKSSKSFRYVRFSVWHCWRRKNNHKQSRDNWNTLSLGYKGQRESA